MTYTRVDLEAIKDSAADFGFARNHEARFATKILGLEESGLSYQKLLPNKRSPFGHHHSQQEEVYIVLSGHGRMKLDDEVIEVKPLDAVRVEAKTKRAFAAGPEGLEFVVYGAPRDAATSISQDAKILPDWWATD